MICELADYRRITRDAINYDGDVTAALVEAQNIVEQRTERFYESATRTEKLYRYPDGAVYPLATPITSVSVPVGATINGNAVTGTAWSYGDAAVNWYLTDMSFNSLPVEITYIGGYAPGNIPAAIVKVTAEIAKISLSPLALLPAGASSIAVGDVNISGSNLGGLGSLPSSITRTLREWKKRND